MVSITRTASSDTPSITPPHCPRIFFLSKRKYTILRNLSHPNHCDQRKVRIYHCLLLTKYGRNIEGGRDSFNMRPFQPVYYQHIRPPGHVIARNHPQRCRAQGTVCRNRVYVTQVDGRIYRSPHCEHHACRSVDGGHLCPIQKMPSRYNYCDDRECFSPLNPSLLLGFEVKEVVDRFKDLQCAAMERGVRCSHHVKDDDPNRSVYCAQFREFPREK